MPIKQFVLPKMLVSKSQASRLERLSKCSKFSTCPQHAPEIPPKYPQNAQNCSKMLGNSQIPPSSPKFPAYARMLAPTYNAKRNAGIIDTSLL